MLHALKGISALVAVAVLAACATSTANQSAVRSAIEAGNKKWEAALSRGDAAGIAALYTPTAQLLPPNGNVVSGQHAIQQYWQGAINSGFKAVTLTTLETETCGDTAYEVGKYSVSGEDGKIVDTGDYIVIFKHDRGQWKLHRDIWTTNAPAPAQ